MMNIFYTPARDIKEHITYLHCLPTVVHICDSQKVHIYQNTGIHQVHKHGQHI